jgi:hypothetical protein
MQFSMRVTSQKSVNSIQGARGAIAVAGHAPAAPAASFSPPVWGSALATLLVVFLLGFGGKLKALLFDGRSQAAKGRWIRDRSLGGKMVFVSDDNISASSGPSSPRMGALGEDGSLGAGVSQVRPPASGDPPVATVAPGGRPEWWTFTAPLPVTPMRQLECKKRAKKILKQLEDQKLVGGKDYDVFSLVQLHQACKVRSRTRGRK